MCTLREVPEGETVEVVRLSRHTPFTFHLREMGFAPGSCITVQRKNCHSVLLRCNQKTVTLPHPWDTRIHVVPWEKGEYA